MICECAKWARTPEEPHGQHHHGRCPKYATDTVPWLVCYDPAFDAWTLAPDNVVDNVFDFPDSMERGSEVEIRFKRVDMTDKEINELPEA